MLLQERIYNDMRVTSDVNRKNILRVLVAEMQRGNAKVVSDVEAQKIVNTCIKNEKVILENARSITEKEISENNINILSEYVDAKAVVDHEEIKQWIINNVDFSKYPNKMAAMRELVQHYGTSVDGTTLKNILLSIN